MNRVKICLFTSKDSLCYWLLDGDIEMTGGIIKLFVIPVIS